MREDPPVDPAHAILAGDYADAEHDKQHRIIKNSYHPSFS